MPRTTERAFAKLAVELSESSTVDQTAAQIVAFAMQTVGTQFAGVTMLRSGGRFETVGPSAPTVAQADELQYRLKQGPCVDASLSARVMTSHDLGIDPRWPQWGPGAVALGFRSVLTAELHAGGRRIGALNLYGSEVRQFSDQDADTAMLFAQHSAAALAAVSLQEGLRNALDSRTLIGQAQGVLMERFGVEPDQAFSILRRYSQAHNLRLTAVARGLIETSELPELPAPVAKL